MRSICHTPDAALKDSTRSQTMVATTSISCVPRRTIQKSGSIAMRLEGAKLWTFVFHSFSPPRGREMRTHDLPNQPRRPTPGRLLSFYRTPVARRGCAEGWAAKRSATI